MSNDQLLFFELRIPRQAELNGAPISPEVSTILDGMKRLFADAVISLLSWESEIDSRMRRIALESTPEGFARRDSRIDRINLKEPMFEREHREVLRDWNECKRIPNVFLDRRQWIFAKALVYAAFGIGRFIRILSSEPSMPASLSAIADAFDKDFPDLTELRHGAQHVEDRWRGHVNRKKISPMPTDVQGVIQNGSVDSMTDRTFCTLLPDGTQGCLDVTEETVIKLRDHIQAALDIFAGSKMPGLFPQYEVG